MESTRQDPTRQDELERKYEVDPSAIMPSMAGVPGAASVSQPVEHNLEAVYFDTAGLDLARRGVTLRRRTGGDDGGWHLKLPGGADRIVPSVSHVCPASRDRAAPMRGITFCVPHMLAATSWW